MENDSITRFTVPTVELLRPLTEDDDVLEKLRAVLANEVEPSSVSPACAAWLNRCYHLPSWHEQVLKACDDLLDGFGVESLTPDDCDTYTDCGVGMCPPASYINQGDAYNVTLARDHEHGKWVVASWADLLDEYERAHKLGDYEEFESEPERCPSCHGTSFTLKHFPGSARGDTYAWFCKQCHHHCQAVEGFDPNDKPDDEDHE